MCDWCQEMRWLDAHPLEAAELEFEKADQAAQDAEERGWEDAPALAAEARAAFRHWQQLAEAGQGPEGAERSDANP